MKSNTLKTFAFAAPFITAAFAGYGCAPEDVTTPVTGAGTGGSSSSGATAVGNAGTPAAGGAATQPMGGKPGGGTGSGGTAAGGASGGTAAGGASGGTAGAAGGDCTDPVACIDQVANAPSSFGNPGWKDSWWVTGCAEKNNHDCLTIVNGCNAMDNDSEGTESKGARTKEEWTLGGTPGAFYKVTFTYNGINEGKEYADGTKDVPLANDVNVRTNNDSFYRDGNAPDSSYNVLKLSVFDDKGVKVRHYYMNAFTKSQENHYTFSSSYTKSIVVVGGGKIVHLTQDKNCHAIDNCNAGEVVGNTCNEPRRLPGDDGQLMLPPKYENTNAGNALVDLPLISAGVPGASRAQPWRAQASHLKITAIEKTTDLPAKNY